MSGEVREAQNRNRLALEECVNNLEEVLKAAKLGSADGMAKVLVIIDNYVTAQLLSPGHGRLYKKSAAKRLKGKGAAYGEGRAEKSAARGKKLRAQADSMNTSNTSRKADRADRQARSPSGFHRASAPGESPAPDTGHLLGADKTDGDGGFFHEVNEEEDGAVVGVIGTNVKYAPHLEFGTRHMRARPFFRPAIARATEDISRQVAEATAQGEQLKAKDLRVNYASSARGAARRRR